MAKGGNNGGVANHYVGENYRRRKIPKTAENITCTVPSPFTHRIGLPENRTRTDDVITAFEMRATWRSPDRSAMSARGIDEHQGFGCSLSFHMSSKTCLRSFCCIVGRVLMPYFPRRRAVCSGDSVARRLAMASFIATTTASVMLRPVITANSRVSTSASELLILRGMLNCYGVSPDDPNTTRFCQVSIASAPGKRNVTRAFSPNATLAASEIRQA